LTHGVVRCVKVVYNENKWNRLGRQDLIHGVVRCVKTVLLYSVIALYEACPKSIQLYFFHGKTSDGRLANLITVVGGTFMCMHDFLWPRRARVSFLSS
jgi:hypothetical protein